MLAKSGVKGATKKRGEVEGERVAERNEKPSKEKKDERAINEKKPTTKSVKKDAIKRGEEVDNRDTSDEAEFQAIKTRRLVRSASAESLDPLAEPDDSARANTSSTARWKVWSGHGFRDLENTRNRSTVIDSIPDVSDIANMLSNVDLSGEAKGTLNTTQGRRKKGKVGQKKTERVGWVDDGADEEDEEDEDDDDDSEDVKATREEKKWKQGKSGNKKVKQVEQVESEDDEREQVKEAEIKKKERKEKGVKPVSKDQGSKPEKANKRVGRKKIVKEEDN